MLSQGSQTEGTRNRGSWPWRWATDAPDLHRGFCCPGRDTEGRGPAVTRAVSTSGNRGSAARVGAKPLPRRTLTRGGLCRPRLVPAPGPAPSGDRPVPPGPGLPRSSHQKSHLSKPTPCRAPLRGGVLSFGQTRSWERLQPDTGRRVRFFITKNGAAPRTGLRLRVAPGAARSFSRPPPPTGSKPRGSSRCPCHVRPQKCRPRCKWSISRPGPAGRAGPWLGEVRHARPVELGARKLPPAPAALCSLLHPYRSEF